MYHTCGPWFRKFTIVYKLFMGVINKQVFGVTSNMVKDTLMGWDTEWKSEEMGRKMYI